jgi:hypothetical protein
VILLLDLESIRAMCIAVTLRRQAQQKCRDHERDHALFFGSEDKAMSEFVPLPAVRDFQSV